MWIERLMFMITEGVSALLDEVPVVELPTGPVTGALSTMLMFDGVFPVHELLDVAAALFAWGFALFTYRVIKIIVGHLPFVGGAGA